MAQMDVSSSVKIAGYMVAELGRQVHEQLEKTRPVKQIGAAAVALLMTGSLALAKPRPLELMSAETAQTAAGREPQTVPSRRKINVTPKAAVTATAQPLPEAAPPPPEWPAIPDIEPTVEANLKAVNLSREGYASFLQNLNVSYIPYARQYQEFHHQPRFPNQLPLASVHVLNHYTGAYYPEINGESVTGFIDAVAKRYGRLGINTDEQCCASLIFIDRNGRGYLLAPPHFRVKSNPPHDHLAMPVDGEASDQPDVKTIVSEKMMYANILLLSVGNLHDQVPLEQSARGHAEIREELLQNHPEFKCDPPDKKGCYPVKIDFKKPEMILMRFIMARFIAANPDIWQTPMPAHLLPLLEPTLK